jgi:hypothetical protein
MNDQRHAPAALYPRKRTSGTHWIRGWVGLKSWSGHRGWIIPLSLPGIKPRSSSLQSDNKSSELPQRITWLNIIHDIPLYHNNVHYITKDKTCECDPWRRHLFRISFFPIREIIRQAWLMLRIHQYVCLVCSYFIITTSITHLLWQIPIKIR